MIRLTFGFFRGAKKPSRNDVQNLKSRDLNNLFTVLCISNRIPRVFRVELNIYRCCAPLYVVFCGVTEGAIKNTNYHYNVIDTLAGSVVKLIRDFAKKKKQIEKR